MDKRGSYQQGSGMPNVANQVTLTVWAHTRVKAIFAIFTSFIFAALLGTSIWLAMHPILLPGYTYVGMANISQRTYTTLLSVGGNFAGALCGLSIAHGVRAWATRELRHGSLTLGRYSALVAWGNATVLTKVNLPFSVVFSIVVWLAVNQVSSAVTGIYGVSSTTTRYVFGNYRQIDIDPSTGLDLTALFNLTIIGFNSADFEQSINSLSNAIVQGADPFDEISGIVDNIRGPLGYGIDILTVLSQEIDIINHQTQYETGNYLTADKHATSNLNATFGKNTLQYRSPLIATSTTCVPSSGSATRVSSTSGSLVDEWILSGACTDESVAVARTNYSDVYTFVATCPRLNPPGILTEYFNIAPATNTGSGFYTCTTILSHGRVDVTYQPNPPLAILNPTSINISSTASATAHNVVRSMGTIYWVEQLGIYGSYGLNTLAAATQYKKIDPIRSWEAATNLIYGVAATKILNSATANYGGSYYQEGRGTALDTALSYTVPVFKIGAQKEKAALILIFVVCLVLSISSAIVQIYQPHTSFNPLELPAVLAVAQNSPFAPEMDGACAGKVKNIANPHATVSYGVLQPGHLGFSWSNELEDPEEGQMYA